MTCGDLPRRLRPYNVNGVCIFDSRLTPVLSYIIYITRRGGRRGLRPRCTLAAAALRPASMTIACDVREREQRRARAPRRDWRDSSLSKATALHIVIGFGVEFYVHLNVVRERRYRVILPGCHDCMMARRDCDRLQSAIQGLQLQHTARDIDLAVYTSLRVVLTQQAFRDILPRERTLCWEPLVWLCLCRKLDDGDGTAGVASPSSVVVSPATSP